MGVNEILQFKFEWS